MLKFIVVGTGRCGTAYIAEVLTRIGIPCGHEWIYSPRPRTDVDILGDSSAQAVPFARTFPGMVLHQLRHPLGVIGSLMAFRLFHDVNLHGDDGRFIAEHFAVSGDPLRDAMRYYVDWNQRCERPERYFRYRVEDLDVPLLREISERIGTPVEEAAIADALAGVPRNLNTRFSQHRLRWADLPDGPIKDDLRAMALRYGYPVDNVEAETPEATRPAATTARGWIAASPNPVPAGTRPGRVEIAWDTGSATPGEVVVSENGWPERLFAGGTPHGSAEADWIGHGAYDFRLYAVGDRSCPLAHVLVRRADWVSSVA